MSIQRLQIIDFGPLKEVSIDFRRITVFIGTQGAGKSTIAKLFSTFTWLEKRLLRGMADIKQIEKGTSFKKELCGYHRLESFFKPETEIIFEGQHYTFHYKHNKFKITTRQNTDSIDVYKVLYIPSDRNSLSSLDNLAGLKSIPASLATFKDEYEAAKKTLNGIKLPINDVRFTYNKQYNYSYIEGKGYKIRLTDASSGYQAVVPLMLVSEYLSNLVETNITKKNGAGLSFEESEQLKREVNTIMNDGSLSTTVKKQALSSISRRFGYSGFVNIVEEPEQNLYPTSQKAVLYALMQICNRIDGNKLLITTHSPYIIDYLTLAVKGAELLRNGASRGDISRVVPFDATASAGDVSIYQLHNGYAELLSMPGGLPSDSNDLNTALEDVNIMFDALLDIEEDE